MKKNNFLLLVLLFFAGSLFQQAYATLNPITGKSELQVATFDDLPLAPESYWYGDTDGETVFYSGSFSFTNTYTPMYSSWGGFAYSNLTATDFDPTQWLTHQFRSATGIGVEGSANYAVAYVSDFNKTEIQVMHNIDEGDIVAGAYLTNAAYTLNSALNGDGYMGEPFTHGDYYKIIFTGKNVDGATTSSVECYLIDYRSSQADEHFALDTWEWFDLSGLGKVSKVVVTVKASRENQWGSLLPTYFCMDNFGDSKNEIINVSSVILTEHNISLKEDEAHQLTAIVLPENATNKNVTWKSSDETVATVNENGLVTAIAEGTANITVITEDEDFEDLCAVTVLKVRIDVYEKNICKVYPTATTGLIHIVLQEITTDPIQIIDISGKILQTIRLQSLENTIDISACPSGLYLIKIGNQAIKVIKI
ncbi:MAG: DUF4465 domain-containing protein [Bacteroidetes bacterium]|nr:DUF4465 domain-containing protein [Bacteroidota bacterium]MCL2302160.1 DUF4465 domain-containing protein [Lentimicrobiaceae bacterium]